MTKIPKNLTVITTPCANRLLIIKCFNKYLGILIFTETYHTWRFQQSPQKRKCCEDQQPMKYSCIKMIKMWKWCKLGYMTFTTLQVCAITDTSCPLLGILLTFLLSGFLMTQQMPSTFTSLRTYKQSVLFRPCSSTYSWWLWVLISAIHASIAIIIP